MKCLQSDNGGEYASKDFDKYLKEHGISRRLSIPCNPEQNGVAERRNRTVLDAARCLLAQSGLPPSFWAEAVNTANYLRNRCPTRSLEGMTLHEIWSNKPDAKYLRDFGSRVLCLNSDPTKGKLASRSKEGIFLGYSEQSKGYRIWLPGERKVEISRDVKFLESEEKGSKGNETLIPESHTEEALKPHETEIDLSSSKKNTEIRQNSISEIADHDSDQSADEDSPGVADEEPAYERPTTPKRGPGRPKINRTRQRGRPRKLFHELPQSANTVEEHYAFLSEISLKQAMAGPHSEDRMQAMASEVKSIIRNDTWEIVPRPTNHHVIGSRMVLRSKYYPDSAVERREARLVAQGFAQHPGIHFKLSLPWPE